MPPRGSRYRSPLGGRPFSLDPRDMTSLDIDIALQHAQSGIRGLTLGYEDDYFTSGNARYGGGPSSVPCMPNSASYSRFDDLSRCDRPHRHRGTDVDEVVRRTNLAVTLANHNINPRSPFAQLHPAMCSDGQFPAHFRTPKTIESMRQLDSTCDALSAHSISIEARLHCLASSSCG
jgi:hypothetical protein